MKKQVERAVLNMVSKVALDSSKKAANTACVFIGYQSKLPQSVSKLRKF